MDKKFQELYDEANSIYHKYNAGKCDEGAARKALEIIYSLMEEHLKTRVGKINNDIFLSYCEFLYKIEELIDSM